MLLPLFQSADRYTAFPLRKLLNCCVSAWNQMQRPPVDHSLSGWPVGACPKHNEGQKDISEGQK